MMQSCGKELKQEETSFGENHYYISMEYLNVALDCLLLDGGERNNDFNVGIPVMLGAHS